MSSYKGSLIAAMSVFLILDTVAVVARVYVRTLLIRGFGWDDAILCLSFVSSSAKTLFADALAQWMLTVIWRGKVGYVVACVMGFTSMYYGFAAERGDFDKSYYNPIKAEIVSDDPLQVLCFLKIWADARLIHITC